MVQKHCKISSKSNHLVLYPWYPTKGAVVIKNFEIEKILV